LFICLDIIIFRI